MALFSHSLERIGVAVHGERPLPPQPFAHPGGAADARHA